MRLKSIILIAILQNQLFGMSLPKLIEFGLQNNTAIKKSNLQLDMMNAKRDESIANQFGEVSVVGSYTHYNLPRTLAPLTPSALASSTDIATSQDIFSTGLNYSVPLFLGGSLKKQIDIDKINHNISKSRQKLSREELVYNISSLYLSALSIKDIISSQRLYIDSLKRLDRVISKGVAVGKKARIELLKSQNIIEEAKGQLAISKSSLEMIKSNISTITHIDDIGEIKPLKHKVELQNISISFKNFDDLERFKIENMEIAKSQKMVSKVKSQDNLQLSLDSYFGYNYDIEDMDKMDKEKLWQVGVNAKWKLFDFGKSSARVQQAKIAKLQAVVAKDEKNEMFRNLLTKAKYEIDRSLVEYKTNLSQLKFLKENQKIEQARYEAKVSTLNDLLLAKAQTQLSKSKVIESKYRYQNGIYYFDYLLERGDK
jgi:outer membrane protein TolC